MTKKVMTKEEFKVRWESGDDGGGITFDEVADCADAWGVCRFPKTKPIHVVQYKVLRAAGTSDAEEYALSEEHHE